MNKNDEGENEKANNAKQKENGRNVRPKILFVARVISVRICYMRFIHAEFIHGE